MELVVLQQLEPAPVAAVQELAELEIQLVEVLPQLQVVVVA